jgi:hypothetical protein
VSYSLESYPGTLVEYATRRGLKFSSILLELYLTLLLKTELILLLASLSLMLELLTVPSLFLSFSLPLSDAQ